MISVQPSNKTVLVGWNTNFTVTAAGVPAVSYQWSFKGTNISGATNVSLPLNNLRLTNAGIYAVQITNVFGALLSSNAMLAVYTSAVPVMSGLSFSAGNGLGISVGGVPGFNYAVQTSSNLIDWQTVITNASPFNFSDTNALNLPQQFYRVVYLP